jgi:hypothetical protein
MAFASQQLGCHPGRGAFSRDVAGILRSPRNPFAQIDRAGRVGGRASAECRRLAQGTRIADAPGMRLTDLETLPEVFGWRLVSPADKRRALSPRERQILALVVAGRSQKEAAFDLGVSDATVRVLYARAMKKLGRARAGR